MGSSGTGGKRQREAERDSFLERFHRGLELPMALLGLAWLALLIVEFTRGLSPFGTIAFNTVWIIFIADFALEFFISPRKLAYLKHNWLTALSLAVPALRFLRILRAAVLLRAATAARGARLVSIVGSVNRGMRSLGKSLGRRGAGYVVLLTIIVILTGAAAMYSFEKDSTPGLSSYGGALWWTAMIMTTMGSGDWPVTAEGRILCFLLAVYSFSIFGYITAALASFFVGQDRETGPSGDLSPEEDIAARLEELNRLLREREKKLKDR